MKQSQPKNILVINLKYLGDLIVSTAALRAIRCSFPESKITVLVKDDYKDVLLGNKSIDEIIAYDFRIKKQKGLDRLKSEFSFLKKLRSLNFDAVVSLQAGDRYVLWAFLSGAKIRVAPIQNNFGFLLTGKAKVYEDTISYLDYYLKVAEKFGAKIISRKTEFILDEMFRDSIDNFLLANIFLPQNKIIGIHPGASEPTKMWPLENYLKLIELINENSNTKVIVFLGPAEKQNPILNEMLMSRIIFADTSENIQQLAWFLSKCSLLICNDSGARHLAAALKVPTITLFPDDKIIPWKFYSEEEKQFFLLGKRNVSDLNKSFLDSISIEEVLRKVEEIMN